jgi:hypothetical protein
VDSPLAEPLRHNLWATLRLLETCRELTPEQLAATVPGTFGNIDGWVYRQARGRIVSAGSPAG